MPEPAGGSRIMAASPVENADNMTVGRWHLTRPTHDDIARRAYDLYCSRGGADGQDVADWLEAERQLSKDNSGAVRGPSAVSPARPRRKVSAGASR